MLKTIFLSLFLLCFAQLTFSEEIFSLKKSYEIAVIIEGTDQTSIQKGMQNGLSSLLINLSGNSKILTNKSINEMLVTPARYVSQYKIAAEDENIVARFIFQGDLIRSYLSQYELPLWLADKPLILTFLPCREIQQRQSIAEMDICKELEKRISDLSFYRKSKVTKPLMDLKDINYLDSLNSLSPKRFMTKLSRRYAIDNWMLCLTQDEFGLLLEEPKCLSSLNEKSASLETTFNNLLDEINNKRSLIVNKAIKNETLIRLENVISFSHLETIIEELNAQVLVFDVSIQKIEGSNIDISLSHFGSRQDLKNLLGIHEVFKENKTITKDIISYKYNKT
ncbi:MAG: DUF2066 domain-containing protein [Gammaproteobacteria bacterium]|tara:strand:- start:162 stop:1172 length:1011 start_codon:yes stop_codon:yes gene_type:complete